MTTTYYPASIGSDDRRVVHILAEPSNPFNESPLCGHSVIGVTSHLKLSDHFCEECDKIAGVES